MGWLELIEAENVAKRICLARHIAASSLDAEEYAFRCAHSGLGWDAELEAIWLKSEQPLEGTKP